MKIAIVKLSAMGDIIHAMGALQFIKKHLPNTQIDWIVEQGFVGILEDNPHIDNILPINLKALKKNKLKLLSEIKGVMQYADNSYDIVIDAQGLIKSAMTAKLLNSGNLWGFSKDSIREKEASYFYNNSVHIPYHDNTIDRNMRVLSEPFGFDILPKDILEKEPFLYYQDDEHIDRYISTTQKNIIFVVGSTWESRNYPKEHFATIANALQENIIIIWGNKEEREIAEWIAYTSLYATVIPRLSYNSLKAIIAKSDLLIGNDTGPTHIAWGLNIPSITIFGPTPINRVYQTPINKVIKSDSSVDHYKLDKNDFSIQNIDPMDIVTISQELLYD